MFIQPNDQDAARYARCIAASKRVRWDIDADVIKGRSFDLSQDFLPEGLSQVSSLAFLSAAEQRYLGQIQGRTYANIFSLAERFVNAKILEISREYWFGDQVALEALVRFSDEELKHQALFRKIEQLAGEQMAPGYALAVDPDQVARAVLGKSTWAVLALTLDIELFTQAHYRESIGPNPNLSPLFKDVFLHHWREESQHAIIDELEWRRENARLSSRERDSAVDDFIALVAAVDGILQAQARADADYFVKTCGRSLGRDDHERTAGGVLKAYRWQFIFSGAQHPQFVKVLSGMITEAHGARIQDALNFIAASDPTPAGKG